MADTVGTLIDTVLERVRDPQGSAHSRTVVRDVLTATQRAINQFTRASTTSLTLTTTPWVGIYPIHANWPTAGRLLAVRDGGRDLVPVPWTSLTQVSHTWLRDVGTRHEVYAVAGRDTLIVYPVVDRAVTLTLVAASSPVAFDSEDDVPTLPTDLVPLWLDLTVAIVLVRGRQVAAANTAFGRVAEGVKAEVAA